MEGACASFALGCRLITTLDSAIIVLFMSASSAVSCLSGGGIVALEGA